MLMRRVVQALVLVCPYAWSRLCLFAAGAHVQMPSYSISLLSARMLAPFLSVVARSLSLDEFRAVLTQQKCHRWVIAGDATVGFRRRI